MIEYYEFRAMNSDIVLAAETDAVRESFERRGGFQRARDFIEASEMRFTRFFETSELMALNRAAGEWLAVSSELYELMREARDFVDETGGLFDPSLLDVLERVGYDKSMDEIRRTGANPLRVGQESRPADIRAVEFDAAACAIRLPRGLRIDLGGIAKGWIAERAARILADYSNACAVSAGGDMFMIGLPTGEAAWEVGLEDPRDPNMTLTVLRVGPGAVATSSITKRRWEQGGRERHHLIDPRTRLPAETDWLSVTVLAPHATSAEVFAKVLLIAGSRAADRIAARRDDITYIAVDAQGELWSNEKELMNREIHYR